MPEATVRPMTVQVSFHPETAEALASANSDLLCWIGGWLAARGDEDPSYSLLVDALRKIRAFNADLKDAIDTDSKTRHPDGRSIF